MGRNKITRWIDRQNYRIALRINQLYYRNREAGKYTDQKFFLKRAPLVLCRLILCLLNLFRFNPDIYQRMFYRLRQPALLGKAIAGLAAFDLPDLLPLRPTGKLDPAELLFEEKDEPLVTIVIAAYNQVAYTYNCLLSVRNHTGDVDYEVIVIDDCSSDPTSTLLSGIQGITYLRNEQNLGFLRSCNRAAEKARGRYLCLLNNDLQVRAGWLSALLSVFRLHPGTGLAGSKLIYPNGLLQEAGGLIDYLGQPSNYGRYEDPADYRYNYLRETDYCSGASMLITTEDFKRLGGFDERYVPAYYEDTDLAMAVRHQLKKKVWYQPLSEVVHFEGITSGKTTAAGSVKSFQVVNAAKFKEKWSAVFSAFPHITDPHRIALKFIPAEKRLLFIDATLPFPDRDSGSRRIHEIMTLCLEMGYHLSFLPFDSYRPAPYYGNMVRRGIRIIYTHQPKYKVRNELISVLDTIDVAWICKPRQNAYYGPLLRAAGIKWIFDTVDLHFLREARELALLTHHSPTKLRKLEKSKKTGLALARAAHVTLAITPDEQYVLRAEGLSDVVVVPNIHHPYRGETPPFAARRDICFIGGYNHSPNVDAVTWLVEKIMPMVWAELPDLTLNLLGSAPSAAVRALAGDRVAVTGYLEDVEPYFLNTRVFVAPLRYGAGMKGKLGQALEYKLPIVTTTIGAEGMQLIHGRDVLIADEAADFARHILLLYRDPDTWQTLSENAHERIRNYAPNAVKQTLRNVLAYKKS